MLLFCVLGSWLKHVQDQGSEKAQCLAPAFLRHKLDAKTLPSTPKVAFLKGSFDIITACYAPKPCSTQTTHLLHRSPSPDNSASFHSGVVTGQDGLHLEGLSFSEPILHEVQKNYL